MGANIREGSEEAQRAVARPGRYQEVADNLEVKEVVNDDDVMSDRFSEIEGSDKLPQSKRSQPKGQLEAKPGLYRFLRVTKCGFLRVDRARVALEEGLSLRGQ